MWCSQYHECFVSLHRLSSLWVNCNCISCDEFTARLPVFCYLRYYLYWWLSVLKLIKKTEESCHTMYRMLSNDVLDTSSGYREGIWFDEEKTHV